VWCWGEHGLSVNPSITPEFIEKHINKPWNWGEWGLSTNLMKIKITLNSDIKYELIEKWGIPPGVDSRPIFKKGGIHYWETWNELLCLKKEFSI
jgi:hypothetical protein